MVRRRNRLPVCGPDITAFRRPDLASAVVGERAGNCVNRFRISPRGASVVHLDPDAGGVGDDAVEVVDTSGQARPTPPPDPPVNLEFIECPVAEQRGLVAFQAEGDADSYQLFLDPANGSWATESDLPPCEAVLSADGRRWAWGSNDGVIVGEVGSGQAGARRVGAQAVPIGLVTFTSAAGDDVLFVSNSELFRVPFDGSSAGERVGASPRGSGIFLSLCPPSPRPRGLNVAGSEGGLVMVVTPDRGLLPVDLPAPPSLRFPPAWAECRVVADGRYAQLSTGGGGVVTFIDLDTGGFIPLVTDVVAVVEAG